MSNPPQSPILPNTTGNDENTWRCGQPYRYAPKKPEKEDKVADEHWKKVADHLMAQEKEQCDAWKDEIEKLLIFSGLFSAVVTGLLVESHKALRQDPIEARLIQILVNGTHQGTAAAMQDPLGEKFSPSESDKRVNALWFVSLVLSLSTALFGIVALQWFREYLRPSPQNTPIRQLPATFQMQADALKRFHIPHLLKALPLLLVISLVLFLIGLIDFLWALNHEVAAPVWVAIGLVFSLLLYTTLYPAFQHLPIGFSPSLLTPTPCPYKSPQSWLCFKLVLMCKALSNSSVRARLKDLKADWFHQGPLWLRYRDIFFMSRINGENLGDLQGNISGGGEDVIFTGIYDTVKALQVAYRDFSTGKNDNAVHALQCFTDITQRNREGDRYLPLFPALLVYINDAVIPAFKGQPPPRPSDVANGAVYFLVDRTRLHFLLEQDELPPGTPYHLELAIRTLRWSVDNMTTLFQIPPPNNDVMTHPYAYLLRALEQNEDQRRSVFSQLCDIFETFFNKAADYYPEKDSIGQTIWTSPHLPQFLSFGTQALALDNDKRFREFRDTFKPEGRIIGNFLSQKESPDSLSFLLVVAAIFLQQINNSRANTETETQVYTILSAYNEQCRNQDYIKCLVSSMYPDGRSDWPTDFLGPSPSQSVGGSHVAIDTMEGNVNQTK